jgi:hypothetical protein
MQPLAAVAHFGPGSLLGGNRLEQRIAQGPDDEVYLAIDGDGRRVALKVVRPPTWARDEMWGRYQLERDRLAALATPAFPRVLGGGEWGDALYQLMELVSGAELLELTHAGKIGVRRALELVAEATAALQAAHEVGLFHLDLRPERLLVEVDDGGQVQDSGALKVTGFGLSPRRLGRLRGGRSGPVDEGVREGAFLAPEQARGLPVDGRADLYAVGAIICAVVTGHPPLRGEDGARSPVELWASRDLDPRRLVAVRSVALRALAEDPDRRFATARELADALLAALADSATAPVVHGFPTAFGESELVSPALCPGCGEPIGLDYRFCGVCGRPVEPARPIAVARPAAKSSAAAGTPPPARRVIDENVQFTVYRPRTMAPVRWYDLLAFAHLSDKRPDAAPDEPHPVREVTRRAEQMLADAAASYQSLMADSGQPIPQGDELSFVPALPGLEVEPPARVFRWLEPVHVESFRIRAPTSLDGQTVRGHLRVFLGRIIVAEVSLAVRVDRASARAAIPTPVAGRPYRRIFASYSHRDTAIVQEVSTYAQALGDRYLIDVTDLRAGERWSKRLAQLIAEADMFQLFWSWNAMTSPHVRREWEHALTLDRPDFVRPTYWEDPLPRGPGLPPEALLRLHFQRMSFGSVNAPALAPPAAITQAVVPGPRVTTAAIAREDTGALAIPVREPAARSRRVALTAVTSAALALLGLFALGRPFLSDVSSGSPPDLVERSTRSPAEPPQPAPPMSTTPPAQHSVGSARKLAAVELLGAEPGVLVIIDGRLHDRTPLQGPILLRPGKHDLLLKRNGYQSRRYRLTLAAGDRRVIRADLKPRLR